MRLQILSILKLLFLKFDDFLRGWRCVLPLRFAPLHRWNWARREQSQSLGVSLLVCCCLYFLSLDNEIPEDSNTHNLTLSTLIILPNINLLIIPRINLHSQPGMSLVIPVSINSLLCSSLVRDRSSWCRISDKSSSSSPISDATLSSGKFLQSNTERVSRQLPSYSSYAALSRESYCDYGLSMVHICSVYHSE